jgi:hypothetical protein
VHAKNLKKVDPVLDRAKWDTECPSQTMCANWAEKQAPVIYIGQPNKTNTNPNTNQGTILSL